MRAAVLLGFWLLTATAATAGTLIPVTNYPGSATTVVFSINDDNAISGEYQNPTGGEHAFFGPLNGTYTGFDYGGTALGTEARSINNAGLIVGFSPDTAYYSGPEFLRDTDGTFKAFKKAGVGLLGIAQGLNKHDVSVGDYVTDPSTATQTAYQGHNGRYARDLDIGIDASRVDARAITGKGVVAGWYVGADHVQHGFILKNGVARTIDADDSGTTDLEGLNDKGIATGSVLDSDENFHAFMLNTNTGVITWLDVPGASSAMAWGINNHNWFALETNNDNVSYVYCPLNPHKCGVDSGIEIAERTTKLMPAGTPIRVHVPSGKPRRGPAR
jgi:hypothetical protein